MHLHATDFHVYGMRVWLEPTGEPKPYIEQELKITRALSPGITNPPRPWFELSCPGDELPEVRQFLHTVERMMMVEIPNPYPVLLQFV